MLFTHFFTGVYNYKSRVKAHNTFGALDTITWTWSNPKVNVTNEIPRRRYEFVAGFLNNTYLLVGLGKYFFLKKKPEVLIRMTFPT